jgi:hypothetical protein
VVLPLEDAAEGERMRVGVAWLPAGDGGAGVVTDTEAVPGVARDFSWVPAGPPPDDALRACADFGCDTEEHAAVGWLVAFDDVDGDGGLTVHFPAHAGWSAAEVTADGDDVLLGVATDHVVAYTAHDLAPGGGLARTLGWPVEAGTWTMGVHHQDGRDQLSPIVSRERVPIYLMVRQGVLCCGDVECAEDRRCPTFQGQGDRVD